MASRVDAVVRTFPEQLTVIRNEYERTLTAREMSDRLMHLIARFIEDCQRVLDWTATDIDQRHGDARERSPYFPLKDSPSEFARTIQRDFSRVPKGLVEVMERHQPYQPGKSNLAHLHALTRVNKHQDFTPQTRTETRRVRSTTPGGSTVEWNPNGVRFGNGVRINGVPVDPRTQRPPSTPTASVTEVIYVAWSFVTPSVPVLPTLESLGNLVTDSPRDTQRSGVVAPPSARVALPAMSGRPYRPLARSASSNCATRRPRRIE